MMQPRRCSYLVETLERIYDRPFPITLIHPVLCRVGIANSDTMLLLKSLIAFAVLWEAAVSTPLEQLASRKKFTLQQVAVTRQKPWMGPNSMRRAYLKYGVKVPGYVEEAVKNVEAGPPGQTSIGVRPVKGDVEFLVAVQVGNHNLSLDLDTGSSDLYVFPELLIFRLPSVVRLMDISA
jgi:hypothetical protein